MKSKLKNFPGISIDHVLLALLILLVITMAANAAAADDHRSPRAMTPVVAE
ncbi:hypothetical protein OKA05_07265 [Luteolibacter arcticus]|uniref:Uncharacterized protein n=1 Tax=Luteolibacter arcticus TaxID=1581411 RepID=A0ABT3GFF2_9BACT|nr:hypothetical protein [Luteolibacter arcticus]MCW1922347.1 hypothetical protein [Luteolibacter arcticus]